MNGDRAGSLDVREAALALLEPDGDSQELAAAYRGLGTYHMLGSGYVEAITWSERAIELARRTGAERVEIEARNDLGVSVGMLGDPERGLELLRGCVRTGAGSVFYARLCRFHVAECARLTGDWDEAERRLAELRVAAEEQGSRGLTARELEVARLIADGATNAELARALVIAPKTAAAHVSHILDKLGFSSRAQIARWVAEHPEN